LASRIGSVGTQPSVDNGVGKVFEALGLDLKDVRVASALVRKYDNPEQVELAAYRLQREISQSPNPTQAQTASLNGGGGNSNDAKIARLGELQKSPTQNMKEIIEIEKELGWR